MTLEPLLPLLAAAYGWPACRFVERLAGGEWNDVWHVQVGHEDFVVRWAPPTTEQAALEQSHRLMTQAAGHVTGVFPPVLNSAGRSVTQLGNRLMAVMPFIEGRKAERGQIDPEVAGAWLGKLHQVEVDDPPVIPEDHFQIVPAYEEALLARAIDLAALRRAFAAWRRELEGQPSGLLQGDYYPSNIIVKAGRIEGVVDWDEASVGSLVWELGRALWEFAGDAENGTFDMRIARSFLKGYTRAGGSEPDRALLLGAMAQNRLWDALWAFQFEEGFRENLEYHVKHLQAMEWIQGLVI